MKDDPDREILRRCASPDREVRDAAFENLYERHAERTYRLAYRLTRNDAEARDIVQEAFLRAYRRIHRFDRRAAFTSWLHRITVNIAIDRHRGTKRRPTVALEDDGVAAEPLPGRAGQLRPPDQAQRHEVAESIRDLVASLSPRLAAVVVLRYGEGLSYADVAEALDIPVGTVRSRLNRAHELLRPHLTRLREH
jgi:RNA polymerase sigma-70 factor, ECF subfamily